MGSGAWHSVDTGSPIEPTMAGFKQPDFIERQEAAAKARKVALESFAHGKRSTANWIRHSHLDKDDLLQTAKS